MSMTGNLSAVSPSWVIFAIAALFAGVACYAAIRRMFVWTTLCAMMTLLFAAGATATQMVPEHHGRSTSQPPAPRIDASDPGALNESIRSVSASLPPAERTRLMYAIKTIEMTTTDRGAFAPVRHDSGYRSQLSRMLDGRDAESIIALADTIRAGVPPDLPPVRRRP